MRRVKRIVYFLLVILIVFVCSYSFTQKPEIDNNLSSNDFQNILGQLDNVSNNQLHYSLNQKPEIDGNLASDNSQLQLNVDKNRLSHHNQKSEIDRGNNPQNILDQFDVKNNQLHYSIFSPGSDLTFTTTLKSGPNGNVLGIYPHGDKTNQLILVPSEAQVGETVTASFIPIGTQWHVVSYGTVGGTSRVIDESVFPTTSFGFYLTDGTNTLYSEDSLNADGEVHVLVFDETNSSDTGDFLLAWNTSSLNESPTDCAEAVYLIAGDDPTPEPGTLILLGTGFGLAALGKKFLIKRR